MSEVPRASADISHGRGGRGNIGQDTTKYVDGAITRTGAEGDHGDGAFSAGRGGAGNIGSPSLPPSQRKDADAIPEAALRPSYDGPQHVGRGGKGNVHIPDDAAKPLGLADKIKNKLFKKKVETKSTPAETAS